MDRLGADQRSEFEELLKCQVSMQSSSCDLFVGGVELFIDRRCRILLCPDRGSRALGLQVGLGSVSLGRAGVALHVGVAWGLASGIIFAKYACGLESACAGAVGTRHARGHFGIDVVRVSPAPVSDVGLASAYFLPLCAHPPLSSGARRAELAASIDRGG